MRSRVPGLSKAGLALLVLTAQSAQADDSPAADLVVHVSGFKHQRGQAIANLFYEGDDIFKAARSRVVSAVPKEMAVLVFPNIKPGHYAVLVFHDENSNGDLDHNLLRFPAEPWGFSNDFELTLFSGLPSFKKVAFAFEASVGPISIRVK